MSDSPPIVVIGVLGSPHRKGNTEVLLDRFLKGASDAGAATEMVILVKKEYSSCRGCNACHKTGVCVLQDDAPALLERLMEADCIAIASPVYSMGITSELKAFIDRAHYLWVRQFKMKTIIMPPHRKEFHRGYFLSTAGMDRDDTFETAYPMMRALFNILGFNYCENILAKNMDGYQGIENHPDILDIAYKAGYDAVEKLKEKRSRT